MTNDEIRALLADCQDEYDLLGRNTGINVPKLRKAVTALLARQDEALKEAERMHESSEYVDYWERSKGYIARIRNILNPKENTDG